MKRSLIVVLSVLMMVVACPTDDKEKKDDTETVAVEYRGMYVHSTKATAWEVTKNQVVYWGNYDLGKVERYRWPAWNVENELWVKGKISQFQSFDQIVNPDEITDFKFGYFEGNKLIGTAGTNANNPVTYTKE
jgi:hypothetical protein